MTGQPWGRTGRVRLVPWGHSDGAKIIVKGRRDRRAGDLWWQQNSPWGPVWIAVPRTTRVGEPLDNRDQAVMWVLRRAVPDVWRAERPHVYSVTQSRLAADGRPTPQTRWFVWEGRDLNIDTPNALDSLSSARTFHEAVTLAHNLATQNGAT